MSTPESLPRAFGSHYLLVQLHASVTGQTYIALPTQGVESAEWKVVKTYSKVLATPTFVSAVKQDATNWEPIANISGVGPADFGKVGAETYRGAPFFPSKDAQKILTKCFHLKRKTPAAVALEIAAQSALILSEVKQQTGWLHKSIRPAHVLVGYNGKVRLLDFGTAKDILTTQVPAGSPLDLFYLSYSAPEVAAGDAATHQSDLFGVGIVLYELLTGSKLFPAQAPNRETLVKIVSEAKINPPSRTTPGLPAAVDELVLRTLSASPLQRFLTGEEFAAKARSIAASLGAHGEEVVSSFIKEIFAAEIAQEEQFFQRAREGFKTSPPPADASPQEQFSATQTFASLVEPPKVEPPPPPAAETDFLPVPEEEKIEEPKPSTNPLFSLDSLRGPTPKPSIAGPQEGSGVLPVLARLTESRPTPLVNVPLPKLSSEPPPLAPPPMPIRLEDVKPTEPPPPTPPPFPAESQLAATLFQSEPPPKPASSQLDATLLEEPPSADVIPVPAPPVFVEPPKPVKEKEAEPPRRSEPRVRAADPVQLSAPKPSEGNSLWWVLIVFSVIFAASAGGYLLYRSSQKPTGATVVETPTPIIPNKEYKYTLRTEPSGAKVFVNGQQMGRSPIELFFPAKEQTFEYKITISLDGYQEELLAIKPTKDEEKTLTLTALPSSEPATTQAASTQATSEPAAPPKELTPAEKRAAEKAAREEAKLKAAEEKKAKAEALKKEREEKKRLAEEEKKKKAEEAKKKREEEKKKKAEEAKKNPKKEEPAPKEDPKPEEPKPEEPKPEPTSQP